ncbi:MAG: TnsA endonuclease N-terminal domain-containing protein [Anaeromicrobium sp.]|uniref:TnsA endonuclease N-terminal domain-containing protein n=1 Tax=Anaeromicrobium sp. TaxID=1929132 RepID=UPI0025EE8120|nr:TnsA endonuclease N-terminal domain-containing protein [Anaeromicrobium sp.]MCT4596026.1 TnsA endonuclease N-terminal domain-containing protein [Anaeromicrobium sp.]
MNFSKKDLRKYNQENRGKGEGSSYILWTKINEFSSKGRASRIYGIKSNRIHHLHSDNQLRAFLLFEFSPKVIDIRESYPLIDIFNVIDDKETLRFDKFKDSKSGEYFVLTTNFLLTLKDGGSTKYIARAVKNCSEFNRKTIIEKLEIERRYWHAKGIDFKVITNKELNRQFCKNIEWVRETVINEKDSGLDIYTLSNELYSFLQNNSHIRLKDLLKEFDRIKELEDGTGLYLFRYLIAKRTINIDMRLKVDLNSTVEDIVIGYA